MQIFFFYPAINGPGGYPSDIRVTVQAIKEQHAQVESTGA
jgi:hypothetical protein